MKERDKDEDGWDYIASEGLVTIIKGIWNRIQNILIDQKKHIFCNTFYLLWTYIYSNYRIYPLSSLRFTKREKRGQGDFVQTEKTSLFAFLKNQHSTFYLCSSWNFEAAEPFSIYYDCGFMFFLYCYSLNLLYVVFLQDVGDCDSPQLNIPFGSEELFSFCPPPSLSPNLCSVCFPLNAVAFNMSFGC